MVPVVALRSRAFLEWLRDLKQHLTTHLRELDAVSMEEAAAPGTRSTRMVRMLLVVALVLSVCVRASHGVTDSQDSEYHALFVWYLHYVMKK